MLELQRDFRAFLRKTALLKGVGKFIHFADSEQKLRLRDDLLRLHAFFSSGSSQRRKVYLRRDVLFAGSLVRVGAHRMMTNGFQCAAMTSGELLFTGVPIINDNHKSALPFTGLAHPSLPLKCDFYPF